MEGKFKNKLIDINDNYILYDMKNEFRKLLKFQDGDSNLIKWEKYKSYKVDEHSALGVDCDVCELSVIIYNKAWNFLKNCKRPTKQYTKISPNKLVNFFITKKDNDLVELIPFSNILTKEICYTREYKYQLILTTTNKTKEYYRGDTMTSFTNIFNHYKKNFFMNKSISNEIEELAKNYHTIGNMIPVPTGFNSTRAGAGARYDYWDLTMVKIKEWYDNKQNDGPLNQLLQNNNVSVEHCKKWLAYFDNWHDFVVDNYLLAFTFGQDYKPLIFWANHSYETSNLPLDEGNFLNFLKLLNKCIIDRNLDILSKIKE